MEKQQVSTFLKILQIPSNADPEEIKQSLLESGWNEKDADEAVAVLYPGYKEGDSTTAVKPKESSQIVAQKYVKPTTAAPSAQADAPSFTPHSVDSHEAPPTPDTAPPSTPEPAPETAPPAPSTPPATESIPPKPPVEPVAETAVPPEPAPAPSTDTEAVDMPEKAPIPTDIDPEAEKSRPHTDAPWLQQQVDIYDVTEEEKERMIRTVYRTNERLSPQTIHALLGIDVDLSEFEAAYESRRDDGTNWISILIIILSSLAIASVGLFFGLYYFEVGPFHPTVTGN